MWRNRCECARVVDLVGEVLSRLQACNAHLLDLDAMLFDLNNRVSELTMRANGRNGYKAYTIPKETLTHLVKV